MTRKLICVISAVVLVMVTAAPAALFADNNIPTTAISKVLNYKNGLQLTESQIKKLTIIDRTIVDKMIQTRGQAQIRKMEIDKFTSNWTRIHGTAVNHVIKEYYQFLAKLKELELEAIMKTKAVLTREQLKKFIELASIEAMVIKLEAELASTY